MASSTPIYKAYVGVIPTAKGFGKSLEGELSGSVQSAASGAGTRAGRTLGSSITSAFKGALKIGGVITAAVGAAAVGGGISRQLNIEDAEKKLEGLGHTTKSVTGIMDSALASVKGTAYGLDEAATIAAGAVAAGVKPGQELTKYLGTTADAATIAGVSLDEMGFVMNKVQTGQVAYTEDLNMMADRGIPIFQWLQEEYGVTAKELKKMVAGGEVDAATYFKVIEENIGGAALKSGETTRGAFKNMMASISRMGVSLTSGFFPLIRQGLVGLTTIFDAIGPKLEEIFSPFWEIIQPLFAGAIDSMSGGLADWISNVNVKPISDFLVEGARGVLAFANAWKANTGDITSSGFPGFMERLAITSRGVWDGLVSGVQSFASAWKNNTGEVTKSGFSGFMEQAAYWIRDVVDAFKGADYSGFSEFISSLSGISMPDMSGFKEAGSGALNGMADSIGKIVEASPELLAGALELLADALGFVADHMDLIVPLVPTLVAGFFAWKAATEANAAAQSAATLAQVKALPVSIANNASAYAAARAQTAAALAQKGATGATNINTAATTRATIAERLRAVATKAGAVASAIATGAARALGVAIRFMTGPIGLVITAITLLVAGLIWFFTQTELGQKIWATVWGAIKASAQVVADWFMNTMLPILQQVWDGIVAGAMWLYNNVVLVVWNGIKVAIAAVVTWIQTTAVPFIQAAWNTIASVALWLYNNIIKPVWEGIKIAIAVVITAVVLYVKLWVKIFQTVVAPVFKWLYNNIIKPVWNAIKTAIAAVVNWFTGTALPFIKAFINASAAVFKWLYSNVIQPVWNGIKAVIKFVIDWVKAYVQVWVGFFKDVVAPAFKWLYNSIIKPVWDSIKAAIKLVVDWFKNTAWPVLKTVINNVRDGFVALRDRLKQIWDYIKNTVINPVVTWFRDTVYPIFKSALDKMKDAFTKTKDGIGKAWDDLKKKVKEPVSAVIKTVIKPVADTYDKVAGVVGAKKINFKPADYGFWKGGMLPGFTPGRDVFNFVDPANGIRLNLSGGEPIMRPEFGRAMGKGWIDSMNAAARSGGVGGVRKAMGFATGGVFPGGTYAAKGGAWDWVKSKASGTKDWLKEAWNTVTDFIEDPSKAFKAVRDGLISQAGLPANQFGDMLKSTIGKVTDNIISKVKETGGVDSTGSGTVAGAPPQTGSRLTSLSQILGLPRFGTHVTSTRRAGARTAGSGSVSLHALGKAADFAGSTTAMRNFFNNVRNNYRASELIHTPMGGRQLSRGGIPRAHFKAVTARMHYNHVHVGAFKKGGIFEGLQQPRLMDTGGYLAPGVNSILNKTGGYETVIPRAESEFLRDMATGKIEVGKREGDTWIYNPNQVDVTPEVNRRMTREMEAFVREAKKAAGK